MSESASPQTSIHPTAIIDSSAELKAGVTIGPYVMIEAQARIGSGTIVGPSAYIGPGTAIGRDNRIYQHAIVGSDSQALAFRPGDESLLIVGDRNIIREHVTMNRASDPGGETIVGNDNCFMAYSHVAHNSIIGNNIVFANSAAIGGHVEIEDHAILGGLVGIHQFCHIGSHAIVGCNTKVNRDVLPFITVDGHPGRPRGINAIGLRRHRFPPAAMREIRQAYRILFQRHHTLEAALNILKKDYPDSPHIASIVEFIDRSQRGILRPRKGKSN